MCAERKRIERMAVWCEIVTLIEAGEYQEAHEVAASAFAREIEERDAERATAAWKVSA